MFQHVAAIDHLERLILEGQLVAVSLSDARQEIGEPVAALRARYLPALARLLPAAREAEVLIASQ